MTNVMPAWKALKVFWKRSSKSTCTLEMEGKKIPNRDSEKTVKYEIRENRALERAGSFYNKLGSIQRGSVVLLSAFVT